MFHCCAPFNRFATLQSLNLRNRLERFELLERLERPVKPESFPLHHQRYRLSAADAQTCDSALQIQILERIKECCENPRAAGADGMAQSDRAASDIDFNRI